MSLTPLTLRIYGDRRWIAWKGAGTGDVYARGTWDLGPADVVDVGPADVVDVGFDAFHPHEPERAPSYVHVEAAVRALLLAGVLDEGAYP